MNHEAPSTLIGIVGGINLWECPTHGDEAPLVAEVFGQFLYTPWYDLPQAEELLEWVAEQADKYERES